MRSDASSSGRQCDHRMPHKGLGCMPTGAAQREPHSRQRGRADSHASTITQGKGTLEQTILCLCDRTSRKTHIDKMFTYEQVPYAPSTRHALRWVRSDASSSGRQCDHRTPWAQQATMGLCGCTKANLRRRYELEPKIRKHLKTGRTRQASHAHDAKIIEQKDSRRAEPI